VVDGRHLLRCNWCGFAFTTEFVSKADVARVREHLRSQHYAAFQSVKHLGDIAMVFRNFTVTEVTPDD